MPKWYDGDGDTDQAAMFIGGYTLNVYRSEGAWTWEFDRIRSGRCATRMEAEDAAVDAMTDFIREVARQLGYDLVSASRA